MNFEMRLQEKYEAGWKVGFAKGYDESFIEGFNEGMAESKTKGMLLSLTKMIKAMKDAGKSDKEIFDLAHEISDGKIPDEKLRSMIAKG